MKVLSYADDLAVFCDDYDSISEVVTVAKSYCEKTGSAINWDKCIGFWHGAWKSPPCTFANIQWVTMPAQYLGVPLEHYNDSTAFWEQETQMVKEKALAWQGRNLSMFARSTVCNIFLVAKIWYILQALFMSRANVQKLHRVFAVFIWNSTWERCSRTNLFRSVRSGGLGLSHLFVRQIVSRFMFLRNQSDPFLRTMIQVRLSNLLPDFLVSCSYTESRSVKGFLREVVSSFRMLSVRFSQEYLSSVKRKKLYHDMLDLLMPVPLYRIAYSGGSGDDVLKRVKRMPVKPSVKSFFFKLHTNTLPVKTWLADKGLFVPWTTNCLLCKKPETVDHVFIDCWDPFFHWDILQRTLKKELPITPRGIRYLDTETNNVPYDLIMLISLHSIWCTRMSVRHADVDVHSVRENFIESVAYMREVYKAHKEPPDWLPLFDELVKLKRF